MEGRVDVRRGHEAGRGASTSRSVVVSGCAPFVGRVGAREGRVFAIGVLRCAGKFHSVPRPCEEEIEATAGRF